jgi:hypothetical protein
MKDKNIEWWITRDRVEKTIDIHTLRIIDNKKFTTLKRFSELDMKRGINLNIFFILDMLEKEFLVQEKEYVNNKKTGDI